MNDFHPLVSIVIPVYNGSNYLQCAIDSALEQDYDKIEVVVVNDGSTDNTEEIIKSYGNKIKYLSKENGGVATALNMAIQNSNGVYISWLSHDDYYLSNKISRQVKELENIQNRENIIPYCIAKIIDQINNTNINYIPYKKDFVLSKYDSVKSLFLHHIHGCSLLIPKQAFYNVSFFNSKLLITQDYDLWFRFIEAGYLFYYIPEALIATRWHSQQKTHNQTSDELKEEEQLWKFAKHLFSDDIKKAPNHEKKIFNMYNKNIFRAIISAVLPYNLKIFIKKYILRHK
jgi:glycosyltransferase involved in cell wall biosynthesis